MSVKFLVTGKHWECIIIAHLHPSCKIMDNSRVSVKSSWVFICIWNWAWDTFPASFQFSSVAQSCLTLYDPMDCSRPGFPAHHQLPELTQTHVHWVRDAIHLILCCPLLLLASIIPTIRVFSKESVLQIRWPKYWSFSFSISTSNEYSGLISFRIDWLDILAVQGTLKSLLQHYSLKASILRCSAFFIVLTLTNN